VSERITWKWIEESFFPLVVQDARRVGVDTTGWALDSREGPGRALVRLADPVGGQKVRAVEHVFYRFATPKDADLIMQGMRFAWTRVQVAQEKAQG